MTATPMFPLGAVLVPGAAIPLHVFEPRYRELMRDVLAADRRFGVALIERGSEVGGGDQRVAVGTLGEIAQAAELPDGRWEVVVVGVARVRIERWLDDAPYPRAELAGWPDVDDEVDGELRARTEARLRTALGLATEAGVPVPPTTLELPRGAGAASWTATAAAPLGPFDRQRLLCCPGAGGRWQLLDELLEGAILTLRAGLA